MQIKRQEFLNEIKQEMELRKTIRQAIRFTESKRVKEENTLRQIIKKLISEGSKVKVHDTTAKNQPRTKKILCSTYFTRHGSYVI